jgi:hypothetical protein
MLLYTDSADPHVYVVWEVVVHCSPPSQAPAVAVSGWTRKWSPAADTVHGEAGSRTTACDTHPHIGASRHASPSHPWYPPATAQGHAAPTDCSSRASVCGCGGARTGGGVDGSAHTRSLVPSLPSLYTHETPRPRSGELALMVPSMSTRGPAVAATHRSSSRATAQLCRRSHAAALGASARGTTPGAAGAAERHDSRGAKVGSVCGGLGSWVAWRP